MKTFEYTLYYTHRTYFLEKMLREASFVWNHALALQRRYYSLYGKYIDVERMQAHFTKKIKSSLLHSWTVQEILQRLDASYKRFFSGLCSRPPKFKKAEKFSSFLFKLGGGYKLNANLLVINKISKHFAFSYSRPYEGKVKTVRIKRRPTGKYSLYITTDAVSAPIGKTHNGASVGMDFGLKTFLTLSDKTTRTCPLYLMQNLQSLARLNRHMSRCMRGSNNYKKTRKALARLHERIANMREDWHWKLAHELCRQYDLICIEDLNIAGMKRMWGRKVSDMGFSSFVDILIQVAAKYGCEVRKVDRFYASSKTCSKCGNVNHNLTLRQRSWVCPNCGAILDRDLNAAINILAKGITL